MSQLPTDTPIGLNNANLRDQIARELFGSDWGDLSAEFVTDLNALETDAFFDVSNIMQWYALTEQSYTDPSDAANGLLPATANEFFKLKWLARGFRRFKSPEKGLEFEKSQVEPALQRLLLFMVANFNQSNSYANDAMSINSIRREVLTILVRQRSPVVPPFETMGALIRSEFVKLWEHRRWNFRVRLKNGSITTDGDLTLPEGDTDTFDGLASKNIVIKGSSGGRFNIVWADAERFAQLSAHFDKVGRPRFFSDEDQGTPPTSVIFKPTPDKAYNVFFKMIVGVPEFSDDPNSTQGFSKLPIVFRHNLKEVVMAKALSMWGREDIDAKRALDNALGEREAFAGRWEDKGSSRYTARAHNLDKILRNLTSYPFTGAIGQIG